jgi:hypothetical protein
MMIKQNILYLHFDMLRVFDFGILCLPHFTKQDNKICVFFYELIGCLCVVL